MPDIDDNLRDEESLSGFEPGEQGDETFELEKLDKYSGELPDFEFDDEEPVIEAPSEEDIIPESDIGGDDSEGMLINDSDSNDEINGIDDAEEIHVPQEGGSVWDLFEDDEEKAGEIADSDEQEEVENFAEDEADESEEIEPGTFNEEIEESESDFSDNEPPDADDGIGIDNDLKNLIEKDIAISKERRAKKDAAVQNEEPVSKKEFISIDDDEDAQEIDISSMEADRPSTYNPADQPEEGLEQIKQAKIVEEPVLDDDIPVPMSENELPEGMELSKHSKKPSVKPDDTGEVKEKKQKRVIPWLALLAILGVILLLAAISIASYYYFLSPNDEVAKQDSIDKASKLKEEEAKKIKAKNAMRDSLNKESLKHDSANTLAESDTASANTESERKQTIAEQKDIEIDEKQNKEVQEVKKPDTQIVEKVEKKKNVTTPKPTPAPIPKPKPVPVPEPAPTPVTKGIYVVQVYSTPYKSDAEEWLVRLKKKGVENAFLSQQKIRDKIWHRVRFGTFKSKEEARLAAKKYGFAQSWIDRIE